MKRESERFAEQAAKLFTSGNLDAPLAADGSVGYLGRTIHAGLGAYRTVEKSDHDLAFESVARALERQSQREVQNMKKGLGLLATVSSTAPFVGLLGTVMGIVTAFQQMAASGSGGLGTVSAGIAEALITTAFGLLVAIPAVFAFNYLQGWTDSRAIDLAESCNEFLDLVARRLKKAAA
jgi:biopolymer transport protein ExbB/biopolymer transport protein TolQ